jgi:PPM family protein phosphatase
MRALESRRLHLEVIQIRPGIEWAGLSDVGCQRENNEDRYSYWEPAGDEAFQRKGRLAVVADGMGGYEGGQEASRIALETIEQVYGETPEGDPRALLLSGFQAAHHRIQAYAAEHPELRGMGTTCTAMAVVRDGLYYAHVGDSRLYLWRDSKIYRLTRDHSYVGRLVEQGIIDQQEAASHPQRNILIMALGASPELAPESPEQPISVEKGDVLLLCTDGLWTMVSDDEMQTALASNPLDEACHELVKKAKERGGPDNITLQLLRIAELPTHAEAV